MRRLLVACSLRLLDAGILRLLLVLAGLLLLLLLLLWWISRRLRLQPASGIASVLLLQWRLSAIPRLLLLLYAER